MCWLPAEPFVFPAYIRSSSWTKGHFLDAKKLPCMPVQKGASPVGAWIVIQSVSVKGYGVTVDADSVIRTTVLLSGVRPVRTSLGAPVTNYRPSLHDLAVRFPTPYATAKSRLVRATGSYRVPGVQRYACFQSKPMQTCAQGVRAVQG